MISHNNSRGLPKTYTSLYLSGGKGYTSASQQSLCAFGWLQKWPNLPPSGPTKTDQVTYLREIGADLDKQTQAHEADTLEEASKHLIPVARLKLTENLP